jgi:choline-phosphate cytidylyltransferase
LDETIRYNSVKACKWVDDIIFPAPWYPDVSLLDKHNIDFSAHDALPYVTPGASDCYKVCKDIGRFLPTLRTEGLSTTDILTNILKDRVSF